MTVPQSHFEEKESPRYICTQEELREEVNAEDISSLQMKQHVESEDYLL